MQQISRQFSMTPDVYVHVDQARDGECAFGIDDLRALCKGDIGARPRVGDPIVPNENCAIFRPDVFDEDRRLRLGRRNQ